MVKVKVGAELSFQIFPPKLYRHEIWIRDWNTRGVDGLKPRFSGGPKPKMSKTEWDKIVAEIENKAMTIKYLAVYVKDTRGVRYTYKAVWKILMHAMHHAMHGGG